ncbi:MAG: hypothetical protein JJ863_30630 [Deltaproteobacteria bacterium]|nr:hypothetical protein [Deltaproteobacteria bacterium]
MVAPAPSDDPARDAIAGNIDALWALMDLDSSSDADRQAYKWLCVASDFGHREADERIGDVLEVSSLRYDDDGYEQASAHFELGLAYLEGGEGLPEDLRLARQHLEEAFDAHTIEQIMAGTARHYDMDAIRARLDEWSLAELERALTFPTDPYRAVGRHADRLRRLRELNAPAVIRQHEAAMLREAVDAVLALDED